MRALFSSDVAVASLFFALALAVRCYFAATHPYFNGLLSVRGVPYLDGQIWTSAAIHLIHGEGLGTSYRPFYSILLALFFVWTNWSFPVITCVNVVIGAISAPFLFLTARLTFNRWIAFAVATFFAFDPSQLIMIPQAGTESPGLLFFILSVYFMLDRGSRRRASATVLSGIFLGLSNLTRPLTLFCFPFYVLLLAAFEWARAKSLRRAVIIVSLFTLGTALTIGPWLIRQKLVYNVWSVSTNMGEALYAATSPKYKSWSMRGRLDLYRAGVRSDVRSTYSFYMQKSIEQIRKNPGFYLAQTGRALWVYLNCFDRNYRSTGEEFASERVFSNHVEAQTLFVFVMGTMLLLAGLWKVKHDAAGAAIFLAVSLALIALRQLLPPAGNFLIVCAGFIFGLVSAKSRQNVSLLACSLLVTGVGGAIFNNTILYRAVLLTDWLFACFYLAAFFYAASASTSVVVNLLRRNKPYPVSSEIAPSDDPFVAALESRVKQVVKILVLLFLLFASISATRIIALNLHAVKHRPKPIAKLNNAEKKVVLQKVKGLSPSLNRTLPSPDKVHFYAARPVSEITKPPLFDPASQLVIAIESGDLPYFVHYFPEGTNLEDRSVLFKKRPFEYSVFRFAGLDVVFPGRIPRELCGRPAVLAGRVRPPARRLLFVPYTLECNAIIPMKNGKTAELDYSHIILAHTKAK